MCCSCSIRGWLIFFTILQVIGGMSFIVTPWKYYRSRENDLDERLSPVRWTIFTAGVVSFLLGITGLHGARKKNKNFLITHGFVYKQPCMDLIVKIYMDMNIVRNTCIFYVVVTAIVMLLALVMTRRIQKASSAEVTMDLSYRNAPNMEMATTPQAPPMLPATQAHPMLSSTQAPLHASSYYQPPPPYQYDGKH
ncbi:uncharacterized protein LOC118942827 isoform X3 [Oncorhynchus mykiss]|uniref:uncharacterized protein LOC118942827 isoform X3 n=1 Tax=Oncorhynchus mykiss TaxID=8022 RepID=UPI001878D48C|nr:uncharacterized protein LOC118942827 isoform X3 [Oncorhynchus mykiss]